ncbi:MAG: potassium transporter Kup [Gemmatimonadetes bacterium]|nr:potassium transporter Kup [Gemmatimonadota bacterium]
MSPRPTQAFAIPRRLSVLTLAALGVVYGDIGTSVLYALRECFAGTHPVEATPANVLGVLSLIFWSLIVIISVKYLLFVMRADNRGEGGILALMALVNPERAERGRAHLTILGLFGAALVYGDGMITPAISVLSAVEGLRVATPVLSPYVIPLTIAILVMLFAFQRHGTQAVGRVFGPITLVWFAVIAGLGLVQIFTTPAVLVAVNPAYAVEFFARNGERGYLVLGAVFLCVTGGEALYADMGHFGARPIRVAWFAVVLPALMLNYFGQGALLLADPSAASNPFYRMAPTWGLYPLVAIATAAAVIASQAMISGAFSLTRQAVQLGYSPRVQIEHTSHEEIGQIYIPAVNWALMFSTIALVLGFRTSSAMAAAYGIAVSLEMVLTAYLAFFVARRLWGWPLYWALPVTGVFVAVDASFFGANSLKIPHGGWVPLVAAAVIFVLMTTWKAGRRLLATRLKAGTMPLDLFLENVDTSRRVPGVAVFMTQEPEGVPVTLLHNLKHNKVLHERVVLLTIIGEEIPYVRTAERLKVEDLGKGFTRMIGRYGFMEDPDVPALLQRAQAYGMEFRLLETSYFLGRETLIPSQKPGMAKWRTRLFGFMSQNAHRATAYFRIPPNRVVELGSQVEL